MGQEDREQAVLGAIHPQCLEVRFVPQRSAGSDFAHQSSSHPDLSYPGLTKRSVDFNHPFATASWGQTTFDRPDFLEHLAVVKIDRNCSDHLEVALINCDFTLDHFPNRSTQDLLRD